MSVLSMGMTNDYEVAIEEGATMVRVGTGLFGAQQLRLKYKNKDRRTYKMGVLDKFLDIMKLSDDDDYDDDDFFDDDYDDDYEDEKPKKGIFKQFNEER